ncbi:hypothetical protein ACWGJT_30790, partial [Streptomyces xantholiticus]
WGGDRGVVAIYGRPAPGGVGCEGPPPPPPGFGGLRLLFDGGPLPAGDAGRVLLPGSELRGWKFAGEEEAAELLPPARYERLRWALRARERGTVLNLEAGTPVGT